MAVSIADATVKPHRRWRTFSLRTFLVVSLGIGLAIGGVGRLIQWMHEPRQPIPLTVLVGIAKRHELLMPPKGAEFGLARDDGTWANYSYLPGFKLQTRNDGSIVLLHGT